jgi:hypothetical protein
MGWGEREKGRKGEREKGRKGDGEMGRKGDGETGDIRVVRFYHAAILALQLSDKG